MKPIEKNQEFHQNIALAAIDKDAALLNFHEDGLRDNAESMFAFAVHLYQIKSKELWRHAECSSFKNYCENRVPTLFKMVLGKSQLYRLAEWAEVDRIHHERRRDGWRIDRSVPHSNGRRDRERRETSRR